ncbi:MAG: NAD-dependent epimerase/dehydratase family protein [Candidatus Hydrogenedentes bacterium]|nr:NAD-dependent epimerase/dehydratase family protein [Candidatus Hydrogenedentota bacterium]
MKILITGGAGFVGSRLALGIAESLENTRVTAFDNLKRRGAELNLPRLAKAGISFVHGDVRNAEDLDGCGKVDLIIECSAEPSVLAGYGGSPGYLINTNLMGAIHCFELARRHGAATIFLSTSRVYPIATIKSLVYREEATRFVLEDEQPVPGASGRGISEQFPLEGTRSLYGATKLCAEYLLQEYLEAYGMRGIINRCGVLTGPWQMGKVDQGVVVLWIARHIFGGTLKYIGYGGAGKQVRDMLHIDDLLQLVLLQIENMDRFSGETFNVGGGGGVSVSLQELTSLCECATGKSIQIGSEREERPADIPLYITDNSLVTARTGWEPRIGAGQIVEDIAAWIGDHKTALQPILS